MVDASGVLAQGDYDQNMVVDSLDYTAWRSTYGNGSSGLHVGAFADGNYNNNVDAADYVLWRKSVGRTGPVGQGSSEFSIVTNIPEPGTILAGGWCRSDFLSYAECAWSSSASFASIKQKDSAGTDTLTPAFSRREREKS